MDTRNANPYKACREHTIYNSTHRARGSIHNLGIVDEIYPEAVFKQNQLIVNVNARFSPNFSVIGLLQPELRQRRHRNGIELLQPDPGLRARFVCEKEHGLPDGKLHRALGNYVQSISDCPVGQALQHHDRERPDRGQLLQRPALVCGFGVRLRRNCRPGPSQYVQTSFGCLDTIPQAGETILPVGTRQRTGRGGGEPARQPLVRHRSQGCFAKRTEPARAAVQAAVVPAALVGRRIRWPWRRWRRGRGGGGGGGGGGGMFGGGGGRGGMSNTGHKYSLTFSAQALNLFNDIDYGTPTGSVAPTFNSGHGNDRAGQPVWRNRPVLPEESSPRRPVRRRGASSSRRHSRSKDRE